VSHISFSWDPEWNRRRGNYSSDEPSPVSLAQMTGKLIPVYDQDRAQVGSGVITDFSLGPQRIEVGMEVVFTDERIPLYLGIARITGFSLTPTPEPEKEEVAYQRRRRQAIAAARQAWTRAAPDLDSLGEVEVKHALHLAIGAALDAMSDLPAASADITRKEESS
jgi:hypothetical protein